MCNFSLEELERGATDRAGDFAAAPLLADQARDRGCGAAVVRAEWRGGDRLLTDGVGVADGGDDAGARRGACRRNDWRSRNPEFQEPKLTQNLALVERLKAVGGAHGCSPGEVAIAWTLRDPVVTGAIVGARNAKQVEGIVGAAGRGVDNRGDCAD